MPRKPPKYTKPDDTNVRRVQGTPVKDGWKIVRIGIGYETLQLLEDPQGQQYVVADSRAKADLIVEFTHGLSPVRYQLYDGSSKARKVRKAQRRQRERVKS